MTQPTTTVPPPLEPAPVGPPTEPAAPENHRGRRIASYVLLITGGTLIAVSAGAGAVAAGKAKDLEKMSMDPNRPAFDPSIEKSGKTANKVAIATGILGAVAGVTGGILLLTSSSSSSERVALFPLVGPQLAGGGARVTF